MKKAFKNISWFFKQEKRAYLICLILLIIISVVPLIPAKILGMAIDSFSTGTLTIKLLIIYII